MANWVLTIIESNLKIRGALILGSYLMPIRRDGG